MKEFEELFDLVDKKIDNILEPCSPEVVRRALSLILTGAVVGRTIQDDEFGMKLARSGISKTLEAVGLGTMDSYMEGKVRRGANDAN